MKKLLFALCAATTFATFANETDKDSDAYSYSPIALNLFAPLQFPPSTWDVYGLRLNLLFGQNANVYGVDVGVVGLSLSDVYGFQSTVFNWNEGTTKALQVGAVANLNLQGFIGLQAAGICNMDLGESTGVQFAGLLNKNEMFRGLQVASLANICNDNSKGVQIAFANAPRSEWKGVSVGFMNYATKLNGVQFGFLNFVRQQGTGVQIGAFNAAQQLTGLQIGLLNMICNGYTPLLPVANFSF
jgi:hypothetical protein